MSYPFTKALTWSEFIAQMDALGVKLIEDAVPGVDGKTTNVSYFENQMDGEAHWAVVDIPDRSENLMPSMLRYLCRNLCLHPSLFGLDLG